MVEKPVANQPVQVGGIQSRFRVGAVPLHDFTMAGWSSAGYGGVGSWSQGGWGPDAASASAAELTGAVTGALGGLAAERSGKRCVCGAGREMETSAASTSKCRNRGQALTVQIMSIPAAGL